MKRSIFRAAATAAVLVFAMAFSAAAQEYRITLNDLELLTDEALEMRDLELFIPLDDSVLDALGAEVAETDCVDGECFFVRVYGAELGFIVDGGTMIVDGLNDLTVPDVFKENDVYYVPARAFFEAIDFDTEWEEEEGLLKVGHSIQYSSAQERMAEVLGLKTPEELEEEMRIARAAADAEQYYLDYTYENTVKMLATRTGGDKTKSRAKEKGDYYNQFKLRYQGYLRNGYDFMGVVRANQTTEPDQKKGELKKMELTWWKDSKKLSLYDVQPKFQTRYVMRSYPIQGVSYERTNNLFTWMATAGKAPKRLRRSLYARYIGAVRLKKEISEKRNSALGASYAMVRDTGNTVDNKKQRNYVIGMDYETRPSRALKFRAEAASGYNERFGVATSRGVAKQFKANFSAGTMSAVASYERTGAGFYSETSSFTRGRREAVVMVTKKLRPGAVLTFGARDKKIKDRTTKFYPVSFSVRPLADRNNFNLVLKRDFEKTTGGTKRIVEKKAVEMRDMVGTSRVEMKFNRQKNKTPGGRMYFREQKIFVVKSPLSERIDSNISHKRERWKMDRTAATRQSWLKLDYEPIPWTEMSLHLGRYYNSPQNARTTTKFAWHKIDIFNDKEWKIEYKFENYRDYNVNSATVSYSFFR